MHELLYTSAAQGLRPGMSGFCTVEMTSGMSPGLCNALESLSSFNHNFNETINWMYVQLPGQNKRRYVISRVSALDRDYSGRSNMIAHHLCLTPEEASTQLSPSDFFVPGGPLKDQWSGQVGERPPLRLPPRRDHSGNPRKRSEHWTRLMGDAEAASVVLRRALQVDEGPLWLVRTPEINALAMTVELLRLLPQPKQWDLTFCTYLNALPSSVNCQLRWVLADSPAYQSILHLGSNQLVDLREGIDGLNLAHTSTFYQSNRDENSNAGLPASSASAGIFVNGPMVDFGERISGQDELQLDIPPFEVRTIEAPVKRQSYRSWWTIGVLLIIVICLVALIITLLSGEFNARDSYIISFYSLMAIVFLDF